MTRSKLLLCALLAAPLLAAGPASAASTHNLQSGAHTKNPHDTAGDAMKKQMHMKRHMRRHKS